MGESGKMKISLKEGKLRLFADIFRNMKWAVGVLSDFKVRLRVYSAVLIIQAIYSIYLTTRMGSIIDLALEDNVYQLVVNGLTLIALYIFVIFLSVFSNRFSAVNYNGMYNELELKVYRKIMDSSWEELTEYHSGDLITRLTTDIKVVAGNTSGLVPTIIAKGVLITASVVYILYLDFSMVVVIIIVAPLIVLASRAYMGKIYGSQKKIKELESRINSYNKETFNNIQAVKAFGLGNLFYDRMNTLENDRKDADLKSNRYSLTSWSISYFIGIIGASVCIGWMFYRVHAGVISFGYLSVLGFLAVEIANAAKEILNLVPTMMDYLASSDRVRTILALNDEEEKSDPASVEKLIETGIENGVSVEIDDMFFKYKNGYSVFEGASLRADPGEIIALVGPSGEGKTTMLRIILGIVTAYAGNVRAYSGSESISLGKQTRSIISYVPQGNTMMEGTIMENMQMVAPEATKDDIIEALKTACIYEFIEKLPDGLDHKLGESGLGFSEGQNQRLSIARALLKDVPILLMDEATSALDVVTERRVLDNIMKKNPKKTVILTTHRPTVLTMCDRVYRIANKKVNIIGEEDIKELIDEF